MNEKKFGPITLTKLKYSRGGQIILTFYKIGSPQKLDPSPLIYGTLRTLRKVLLNHAECIEI